MNNFTQTIFTSIRNSVKKLIAFCWFLLVCNLSFGQTIIASEGLNNTSTLFTVSGGAYFTGNSAASGTDAPSTSPFAVEGTHSYGVTNGSATLTSSNINTSSYSGISMNMRLASFSIGSSTNGADPLDLVTVEVSPDGGTNYYSTVRVGGTANATWSYSAGTGNASTVYDGNITPVDFYPAAGGARTTDGYSTITVTGLPAVSALRVKITMINNAIAETWVLDNFRLTGTSSITSAQTGNWSATTTWVGGVVPTSASNVVIASGHVVTLDTATGGINTRNSGTTTTVAVGGTFATSVQYINNGATTINGAFQLNAGGFTTSGNNFVYGAASTLNFNNTSSYGVNNTDQFWPTASSPFNVSTLQGGMTLNAGANRTVIGTFQTSAAITLTSATLTLNGTVKINTGGSFVNSPTYGISSTLVYNTGAAFGRGNEWTTAASGAGYPSNVQISNPGTVTTLNMGTTSAQCSGNITIDTSTTLNTTTAGLTVLGNLTSNGTISLGGDVTVRGNWTIGASGIQTNNSKAVFFTAATGTQLITKTGTGTIFFDYLVINKAAGNVQLSASPATSVTINTATGDVLQLLNAGALDLNGQTLTLNNNGGSIAANASGRSITSGVTGATLAITGNKSFSGIGTLVINTNVTTILSAGFDFGVSKVTVNGILQLNGGGFAQNGSAPAYASGSTLLFNTGGNYDMHNGTLDVAGWFRNVASTGSTQAGVPWNVIISNNTSVRYNTANTDNFPRYINGNLEIKTGSTFTLGGLNGTAGDFYLRGNWINSGTFNPNVRLVTFNGASAQTLTGATTFDFLTMNGAGGITLSNNVLVYRTLTLTSGKITLGTNTLTIAASPATISGGTSTSYIVTNSTGALVRNSVGNTATSFPVGLTASYTPLTVTNTGTSNNLSLVVSSPPSNAVNDATKIVNLEWNLNSEGSGAVGTIAFNWNIGNQQSSYNATGTGELGNFTAGPNYAITSIGAMAGQTKTITGVALSSGNNRLVLGNTGAVYGIPPSNDNCSGATAITLNAAAVTENVINATESLAATCGLSANDDVWYSFSTTTGGTYTVTVVGSASFDAVVNVRSGTCNGTSIFCNDLTGVAGIETIVATGLLANTTYYIRVYDYGTGFPANPTFTIAVASPPAALFTNGTTNISFGNQAPLTQSASQTFNLSGTNLTGAPGNITVTAPNTDFQVSNNNSTWGATTTIAYTSATLSSTPVYVRFTPQTSGADSGNITFSGGGTSGNPTIALTGSGVLPAPVATAATDIAATSFDANWNTITGASSGYLIDVSNSATFGTSSVNPNTTILNNTGSTGASGWTETTVTQQGSYLGLLSSGSTLITPAFDLTTFSNANLNFLIRTFGGTSGGSNVLTVSISTNNGSTWTTLATRTALSTTLTAVTLFNLNAYTAFTQVKIRFQSLSATGTIGIGLDDITIIGDQTVSIPNFVTGYNAKPIAGQSTVTSSVTGLTADTVYYYRLRATDGTPSVYSNVIIVNPASRGGSVTANQTICNGTQPAILTLTGNNGTIIKWQKSSDTAFTSPTDIANTSLTLDGATIGNLTATTYFRAVVQSYSNPIANSNYVTITVTQLPTYANLQYPASGTICQSGTFSAYGQVYQSGVTEATGTGTGITAQFGYSTTNADPSTWTNWSNASFNVQIGNNDEYTYDFTPPSSGTFYYTFRYRQGTCVWLYGGYNSGFWNGTTNNSGVLTVNPILTASVNITASETTFCSGTSVTFTATPTNGGASPSYQWYVGTTLVGTDSATYTSTTLSNANTVSVVLTSNATPCLAGSPATSNSISITVNPILTASVNIAASAATICSGTSVTFTATPTNGGATPSYQWYVGATPVGTDSATYTSTTLANADSVSVVLTSNATPCLAGSPAISNSISMTVSNSNTWLGTTGLWSNAANWSCGSVPLGTSNITISSGTPSLDGNFTVGNSGSLTLSGTASLIINSNASLTIEGTADFNARPVTFKSDVNGSAAFGTLTGTLNGATNVTTERYFSAKRAFRFTSSSVTTSSSIKANWQEGVNNSNTTFSNNQNPNPGFGTHITGTGGSANGFDTTVSNTSSLFTFNNSTSAWTAVSNTNSNTINAGVPYRINVRGDRSIDLSLTNPSATQTVLRTNGTLYSGTFNPGNLSATAYAYNLVGNPYQAAVNMKLVLDNATNLNNTIYYVWDPKMGQKGAYISIDINTNTPNNITSASNKFLQPGQACFVRTAASGGTPIMLFQESYKNLIASNALVFKNVNQSVNINSNIKMRLYDSNSLALNLSALDGTVIFFDDSNNNGIDQNDGAKFTNPDEMFSTFNNGALVSIEKRMHPTLSDIIPIRVSQYRGTNYTIVAQGENLNGIPAYLHDQFLQTYTEIPQSGSVNYPFTVVTTNTQTTATDRFRIVYSNPLLNNSNNEWKNFTLYPNPSKQGNFNIILGQPLENGRITIYNPLGEKIYQQDLVNTIEYSITPKQNIPTGVYYVEIQNGSEKSIKKLIIE